MTRSYLIALGGNQPLDEAPPRQVIERALDALAGLGQVVARSELYATPAFPAGSGPDFVNAAAQVDADRRSEDFLSDLHDLEAAFRRTRTRRWGPRTLDLDLLAEGDTVLPDAATFARWRDLPADAQTREAPGTLILPHPRIQDRAFVLIPLRDIAPDWCHPVSGRTVAQMCADLSEEQRNEVASL